MLTTTVDVANPADRVLRRSGFGEPRRLQRRAGRTRADATDDVARRRRAAERGGGGDRVREHARREWRAVLDADGRRRGRAAAHDDGRERESAGVRRRWSVARVRERRERRAAGVRRADIAGESRAAERRELRLRREHRVEPHLVADTRSHRTRGDGEWKREPVHRVGGGGRDAGSGGRLRERPDRRRAGVEPRRKPARLRVDARRHDANLPARSAHRCTHPGDQRRGGCGAARLVVRRTTPLHALRRRGIHALVDGSIGSGATDADPDGKPSCSPPTRRRCTRRAEGRGCCRCATTNYVWRMDSRRLSSLTGSLLGSEILKIAADVRALDARGGDLQPHRRRLRTVGVPHPAGGSSRGSSTGCAVARRTIRRPTASCRCAKRCATLYQRELGLDPSLDSVIVTSGSRPGIYADVSRARRSGRSRRVSDAVVEQPVLRAARRRGGRAGARAGRRAGSCRRARCCRTPCATRGCWCSAHRRIPAGTMFTEEQLGAICDLVLEENARRSATASVRST